MFYKNSWSPEWRHCYNNAAAWYYLLSMVDRPSCYHDIMVMLTAIKINQIKYYNTVKLFFYQFVILIEIYKMNFRLWSQLQIQLALFIVKYVNVKSIYRIAVAVI